MDGEMNNGKPAGGGAGVTLSKSRSWVLSSRDGPLLVFFLRQESSWAPSRSVCAQRRGWPSRTAPTPLDPLLQRSLHSGKWGGLSLGNQL